ncbi:MAG: hypothetical protein LC799_08135 [Actinobacteria bacterium]|nr:hypothetical protein [Actinomycetota bacterium]
MTTTIGRPAMELLSQVPARTIVDVVAAILLILLLVERELMRAAGQRWRHQARAINTAVMPLLTIFVVAMAARLARFL